jgi:hypothetical protein
VESVRKQGSRIQAGSAKGKPGLLALERAEIGFAGSQRVAGRDLYAGCPAFLVLFDPFPGFFFRFHKAGAVAGFAAAVDISVYEFELAIHKKKQSGLFEKAFFRKYNERISPCQREYQNLSDSRL